jgi:uncharacterized membrane protein
MNRDFLLAIILLIIIDLLWLVPFSGPAYQKMIPRIQGGSKMEVNLYAGAIVYLLMAFVLVQYGLPSRGAKKFNFMKPFLLGVCVYGVYDFTAAAVLKNWNIPLAIGDTIWGGILFTATAYVLWRFF